MRLHVGASNAEIAEIISRASLFVSASVHEGFGISLIEALSAGLLPVVEANAAFMSFAERVSDVVLTDYAQPAIAAGAIMAAHARLAADPAATRARLVAAAQPFAWPGVAERYMQVYAQAAN